MMTAECSECGKPVQKPCRKVCSAECGVARKKARALRETEAKSIKLREGLECSECGKPVQKPYKHVCSEECSAAREKKSVILWVKSRPEKVSEYSRHWYEANSKKKNKAVRNWQKTNFEKKKESDRLWRENNRVKLRDRQTERLKTDLQFKVSKNLRGRLREAIKGNFKSGSAVRDLGCSISELKLHLERQFDANMDWANYGTFWEIDHIEPLASFDLTDREQLLRACHWSNLRPLDVNTNRKEGARGLKRGACVSEQPLVLAA
jgi:hypothetical protein